MELLVKKAHRGDASSDGYPIGDTSNSGGRVKASEWFLWIYRYRLCIMLLFVVDKDRTENFVLNPLSGNF